MRGMGWCWRGLMEEEKRGLKEQRVGARPEERDKSRQTEAEMRSGVWTESISRTCFSVK